MSRKLTDAEQIRLERFNQLSKEYIDSGYKQIDLTTTPAKANLLGSLYGFLLSLPFIVISVLLGKDTMINISDNYMVNYIIFMVLLFAGIVIHELIHGFFWSRFTKNGFKDIEFGIIWKSLNPYCTCKVPLNRKAYITGLIMPCVLLGIVPCIISFFIHNSWLLSLGAIMIISAGGDLLIFKMILESKKYDEEFYLDHPTDIGLLKFVK